MRLRIKKPIRTRSRDHLYHGNYAPEFDTWVGSVGAAEDIMNQRRGGDRHRGSVMVLFAVAHVVERPETREGRDSPRQPETETDLASCDALGPSNYSGDGARGGSAAGEIARIWMVRQVKTWMHERVQRPATK